MLIVRDDANSKNVFLLNRDGDAQGSSGVASDTVVPQGVVSRPSLRALLDVALSQEEGRALEQRLANPTTAPTREPRRAPLTDGAFLLAIPSRQEG